MTVLEFFVYLVVAFVVGRIPVVGKYTKSVNTMFHEDGHASISLLTFGNVHKIDLFYNTEGLATTGSRWWIGRTLTTLGGYPFASFMAYVFFYFLIEERYDLLFYGFAAVVAINLLLWVRNVYGIIWLVSFIGILGGLYYLGDETYIAMFLKFVGAVMFVESIASSFTIMKLSFTQPDNAGDATGMRKNTLISARVWGIFFFAQALYFGYLIVNKIF